MTQPLKAPEISFVITVYNKERYLPLCLESITRQCHSLKHEFIFVDDCSTDQSVAVIKKYFGAAKNYTMITNTENQGPAIALNKGAKNAAGKYLFLMDADDILVKNALTVMLAALKKEKADFVFGHQRKTDQTQAALLAKELPQIEHYNVSTTPLATVLSGRYVRMSYLVTKELYLKAKGADETIFIQDESLPLRLGYHARKMITLADIAVYAPHNEDSLSKKKQQQVHDRFFAYYNALGTFSHLGELERIGLLRRAISALWKALKADGSLWSQMFFFPIYLQSKLFSDTVSLETLHKYKKHIDGLSNVRKI